MFGGLELPDTPFSRVVDGLISAVGRAASWLWVVLLAVIVINVTLRYVFGEGRVELEELQWHINAIAFLVAVAYAYRVDAHIRIDEDHVLTAHACHPKVPRPRRAQWPLES